MEGKYSMELAVIIQSKIYEIRGQKVMLDFDLAELYGTEAKRLKASVRRNIKRFPFDFMFELTQEEYTSLRTKFSSLKNGGRGQHPKYLPYAFTEQGVAMLSSVLNSDTAIEVNINIMRAFVAVRQLIANPPTNQISQLQQELNNFKTYIEEVFTDYNDINEDTRLQLELFNQILAELQSQKRLSDKPRNPIGFVKPE